MSSPFVKYAAFLVLLINPFVFVAGNAFADAELRLYEGENEWDLKDRLVIRTIDGATFDYQYRKVCGAYSGCRSVQINSEQDAKLVNISSQDLSLLNDAIAKASNANAFISTKPAMPSLCNQFQHFAYEVKGKNGITTIVEEIKSCSGTRLNDPSTQTIERILNLVVEFAGL